MPEPKPLSSNSRVTMTVTAVAAVVGFAFATGVWATEIASELKHVSNAVAEINDKITTIEDINRRLSVVETRLETLIREARP